MNDIETYYFVNGILLGTAIGFGISSFLFWTHFKSTIEWFSERLKWWHKHCLELEKELAKKDEQKEDEADWWKGNE